MKFLYDAGIGLYDVAARIAALKSDKASKFVKGRAEALCLLEKLSAERAPNGYDYWFHAASLGEFEQARPLIELLKAKNPDLRILLTFYSPSGYEVRKDYAFATTVAYLPSDTRKNAKRFLSITRPKKAIFVKYEFWLNFLNALAEQNIPTYLISAIFRPTQPFFKKWGAIFRKGLLTYDMIYVQDEDSANILKTIGIDRVKVTGDTRFDRVHEIMTNGATFPEIEKWKNGAFTFVAGSSWPQDEEKYLGWINRHPETKVIIAPHEFDDERIKSLKSKLRFRAITWTEISDGEKKEIPSDTQVLIVDTFGKLSSLYRYADAVTVGGGFGAGIHNINEAAVYGVPVIFGPNNRKFKEAADLKRLGGGFEYRSVADIEQLLDKFMNDNDFRQKASEASKNYILKNLGATQTIYTDIAAPPGSVK